MDFIAVPTKECVLYGERVLLNPAHIISVTLMPATGGEYSGVEPAYISIRIAGASVGSEIETTLSSWDEWYLLTSPLSDMEASLKEDACDRMDARDSW
jgi:hypothetical protein